MTIKPLKPSSRVAPYLYVESQINQIKFSIEFQINKWEINYKEVTKTQDLLPNQALIPCYMIISPKNSNL